MKKLSRKLVFIFLVIGCLLLGSLSLGTPINVSAAETNINLLPNAGFEQLDGDVAVGWNSNAWGRGVKVSSEAARTGDWGIEIQNGNYWIRQTVPIVGGKPFEVSAWVLSNLGANGSLEMKLEFYRDTTNLAGSQGEHRSERYGSYDGWENIKTYTETPPNANLATVYFRLYGTGTVYYDDVSFKQIDYIPGVNILADRLFYYEDSKLGIVTGLIGPDDGIFNDKEVDVKLYPEDDVDVPIIHEQIPASQELRYTFDPSLMNLRKPYIMEISLITEQGETLYNDNEKIYRWERPTALREDGTILVDGEPFFPVIGYHVLVGDYGKVNDTINTVQGMRRKAGNETIKYHLDEAHKHGLKVLMPLYPSLGSEIYGPDGIPHVREIVSTFKDHPAIIGWMVRDEPDIRGETAEDLAEVYREIRTIDPVHPTYMVVAGGSAYENYFRVTDIMATDIYPLPGGPITKVGTGINNAKNLFSEKPVYSILQAFQTASYPYLPDTTELRNMAYQSILEGTKAIGYYSYSDPNWNIAQSTLYPGILDLMQRDLSHVSNFVVNGELIDEYKDEHVQWGLWELDGELYAMVLNLTEDEQTVTISLPDEAAYEMEVLSPYYSSNSIFSNKFDFELVELESKLIKFTPMSSISDLQPMLDYFINEGQFPNKGIPQSLTAYIATIERADYSGDVEKVLDHLDDFKKSLDKYLSNDLIQKEAHDALSNLADKLMQRKIKSWLHLSAKIQEQQIVAGEKVCIQAQLENREEVLIQNAKINIHWPDSFGLETEEINFAEFNIGQTEYLDIEANIPHTVVIGEYPVAVELSYNFGGQEAVYVSEHIVKVVPQIEIDFLVANQNIRAIEPGKHKVALTLTNNGLEPVEVTLGEEVSEYISFDFESAITIGARQTVEVDGFLHIAEGLIEDDYIAKLNALINGDIKDSASITVEFTKNLIENGGFEKETDDLEPLGWSMRSAKWIKDEVHSGQHAVALIPDSDNSWNVMNARNNIPMVQGETYRLSGWVKFESTNNSAGIGVRQINASNASVEYTWNFIDADHTDWAYYELEFIPAEDTISVQPNFYISRQIEGRVWFDDFRLEKIGR